MMSSIVFLHVAIFAAQAGTQSMQSMPSIRPKKSYTIQSKDEGERLQEGRGFGELEGQVRMMNLMMVGGSGYEGMEMGKLDAEPVHPPAAGKAVSEEELSGKLAAGGARVGDQLLVLSARAGLKLRIQVSMASMDMGTEEPKLTETAPGRYEATVNFSMKGPWAVKVLLPDGREKLLQFVVK